jgi:hypothetical protein
VDVASHISPRLRARQCSVLQLRTEERCASASSALQPRQRSEPAGERIKLLFTAAYMSHLRGPVHHTELCGEAH